MIDIWQIEAKDSNKVILINILVSGRQVQRYDIVKRVLYCLCIEVFQPTAHTPLQKQTVLPFTT